MTRIDRPAADDRLSWREAILMAFVVFVIAVGVFAPTRARGDEWIPVATEYAKVAFSPLATPQTPEASPPAPEIPAPPQPAPPPPQRTFQPTPPADTPPAAPPPPPRRDLAPPPPAPAPAELGDGEETTVTTTKTTRRGSVITINNHSPGSYTIGSSGITPAAVPPTVGADFQPVQPQASPGVWVPVVTAVATDPAVQSFTRAMLRRVGGTAYYAATGKCPNQQAAPAAAVPVAVAPTAAVQTTGFVATPPQYLQSPVYYQTAPAPQPQYYLMQAAPQPMATPQYLAAPAPAAPKKCRFFGGH
jgi:hypothetical protein